MNEKEYADTVWQCGDTPGGKSSSPPKSPWEWFQNSFRTPCLDLSCCIPGSPSLSQLKIERSVSTNETVFSDTSTILEAPSVDETEQPRDVAPNNTATSVMAHKWLPHQYTVEVWNALVSVLCLNALLQFFTKNPKRKKN